MTAELRTRRSGEAMWTGIAAFSIATVIQLGAALVVAVLLSVRG